jgi:hypothetical protein
MREWNRKRKQKERGRGYMDEICKKCYLGGVDVKKAGYIY